MVGWLTAKLQSQQTGHQHLLSGSTKAETPQQASRQSALSHWFSLVCPHKETGGWAGCPAGS